MKTLKQRFTQWFNKRHKRKGTLWEDRFRSSLVEGSSQALHMVAAYIDLNPVRAAVAEDPKDYRWCGYAEAVGGRKLAADALGRVMEGASGKGAGDVLAAYRVLLFGVGGEQGIREDGSAVSPGFDREKVAQELARGGRLGRADFLRCRVRYFTDGAVLGSRRFVDEVFEQRKEWFGAKRRDGARRIGGLGEPLYCMRALRVDPVTLSTG
jgi:hypothetical protein